MEPGHFSSTDSVVAYRELTEAIAQAEALSRRIEESLDDMEREIREMRQATGLAAQADPPGSAAG
jgi:DNA-binding FadR family transcriptional regulator